MNSRWRSVYAYDGNFYEDEKSVLWFLPCFRSRPIDPVAKYGLKYAIEIHNDGGIFFDYGDSRYLSRLGTGSCRIDSDSHLQIVNGDSRNNNEQWTGALEKHQITSKPTCRFNPTA
jgi:hypothetical protein